MGGIGSFRLSAPVLLLGIALAPMALAETPWAGLMSSRRVECDPNKDYPLKESNGPWTIMACSFSGEGAEKQAKDLVLELRSKYKLEAYAHKVNFKLDDPNGPNMAGAPVRWQYRRFHDRPEQEDAANQLLDLEQQLAWLIEIGFIGVDCHWKWRELALFAGVKQEA